MFTTSPSELSKEREAALRNVVAKAELGFSTRVDALGYPRKHLDVPEKFLAIYKHNPHATLIILLDIIRNGTADDAHTAYVFSVVRDGDTEGWEGIGFVKISEIDLPDKAGITERQSWAKFVERTIHKRFPPQ